MGVTTKQYLCSIDRMDKMINNKLSELYQLKQMACSISISANEDRVQTSPNQDKIGSAIVRIINAEQEIDSLVDEYVSKKKYIIGQMEGMENAIHYQILFARYVEKKTFERIADEMFYSFRQIWRVHDNALREFEKRYGKEYL